MKILLVDIETAPNRGWFWGLWKQNIGIHMIQEPGYTLCWAAKWLGSDQVSFSSLAWAGSEYAMLMEIHDMLDEADAVVHYNGAKFDIPTLNSEFLKHGIAPPSPFKQMDLLRVVKSKFRLPSNKLDYVTKFLGLGEKVKHIGFDLWKRVMSSLKDKEAWQQMEDYNIQDVVVLEELYEVLLPWITNHHNHSFYSDDVVCPSCGSTHYQRRGTYTNSMGTYPRARCNSCFSWFRLAGNLHTKPVEKRTRQLQ